MPFPKDQKVIDLMLSMPFLNKDGVYDFFKSLLRDESKQYAMPAQYMFKDIPEEEAPIADRLTWTLEMMDRFNIEIAMTGVNPQDPDWMRGFKEHRHRFLYSASVDPNGGMDALRSVRQQHAEWGIDSVNVFPAGCVPQVPINDKRMYPLYALCIELDIPIFVNAGVPGPRVPMMCQHVELIDEVCWFFPELKFVMRHGAEPWEALACKLMLKYPNLYYSTSAFAPKHYPKAIIDFANSRGADKIMYSGYFPSGLKLERVFGELPNVPFKDEVWPKFLYENAAKLFKK